jgi:hypothetical protein
MPEDTIDVAELRRAVRGHLAERPAISQSAETIYRALRREYGASLRQIADACAFLVALDHLSKDTDPLGGAEKYYQATAKGILAHEAGN